MRPFGYRPIVALCAAAVALALVSIQSDARSRMNAGSRGSQTWSAPPATKTAPNANRPIERTMAQPGAAARPATPGQQPGGFFNRPGLLGGLAAGFLGAGLLGMLFGNGLFGGLGGLASIFGLLLQVGLVAIVGYMAWTWWQRRNQSQHAYASGPSARNAGPGHEPAGNSYARNADGNERPAGALGGAAGGLGGGFGGGFGNRAAPNAVVPFKPTGADFDSFERLLGEVQTAYGAENIDHLGERVTPEMLSYFAEELEANKRRGVVNRISDVKLLQGDLSEAWREGDDEYATVALRYSLIDETTDRQSGRVVEGGADEATEIWTFLRHRGGEWQLSAIQQTA